MEYVVRKQFVFDRNSRQHPLKRKAMCLAQDAYHSRELLGPTKAFLINNFGSDDNPLITART